MCIPSPKVQQSAFTETSFMGLSGVYRAQVVFNDSNFRRQADRPHGTATRLAGETGHQPSYIL